MTQSVRLEARGLTVRKGFRTLFDGLDLTLAPGEVIQLFGANGSGKSTLLRVLAGFAPPDAGEIDWQGLSEGRGAQESQGQSSSSDPKDFEPQMLLHYHGHREGLRDALTGRENLAFAAGLLGGTEAAIAPALRQLGALHLADLPVRVLSAGQRRRVALARLLVAPRPIWLLDEPLAALDSEGQTIVGDLIHAHVEAGGSAIIATHQRIGVASRDLVLGRPAIAA